MKRYHILYQPSQLFLPPLESHSIGSQIPAPPGRGLVGHL